MLARLKALFLDDAWLKLLALVLAMITWSYIDAELQASGAPPSLAPTSRATAPIPASQE